MVAEVQKCARRYSVRLDVHPAQVVRERDPSLACMRMRRPCEGARLIDPCTREQRPPRAPRTEHVRRQPAPVPMNSSWWLSGRGTEPLSHRQGFLRTLHKQATKKARNALKCTGDERATANRYRSGLAYATGSDGSLSSFTKGERATRADFCRIVSVRTLFFKIKSCLRSHTVILYEVLR